MTDKIRAYLVALADLMEEHGAEHSPDGGSAVDVHIGKDAVQWYANMNAKSLKRELARYASTD